LLVFVDRDPRGIVEIREGESRIVAALYNADGADPGGFAKVRGVEWLRC
jgi:hypothetical protein